MSTGTSIWALAAANQLTDISKEPLHQYETKGFEFKIVDLDDSLWVITQFGKNAKMAFRTAYSPEGFTDIDVKQGDDNGVNILLKSPAGKFTVEVKWPESLQAVVRYTVSFTPANDLFVPFSPRDVIILSNNEDPGKTEGNIHISQTGGRSGLIYASFKKPKAGSFLYFQNLTALEDYNQDTQTSAAGIVGGQWPEIGLSLPPAVEKPLEGGKTYIFSDAFVALSEDVPADQFDVSKGFLNLLASIYLLLPRPETKYHDYPDILSKALVDIQNNKGCWSYHSGHPYLNAYVCDYANPPEIMVQLAVLLPVKDYILWSGETCKMEEEIKAGLSAFYNEQLGTVMRWLPAQEQMLDYSEEHKKPLVMDSWYLHHPLLNLARLASFGDNQAKDLLLKSVDYSIKVAHHFNYVWPVFYKMDTLEIIKAETAEGKGGEKDVAGLYAHVMLQVWEITGDKKYFEEAEKAAQSMIQHGFDVFYQANNTMFSAKAMILLYKETKNELYLNLSYLFLANVFKNTALWECNYGYGKNFPTFFELFPLNDAPYTAVYEEQEAYAGVNEYLSYAKDVDMLPSVSMLLAEFIKYVVHRAVYYYPPMLPEEMLVKEPTTGEIDRNLWVALEDIHDGWEQSGSVGQEVYGAGLAFGIVPRQYIRIPDEDFMVFIDYPVLNKTVRKDTVQFQVLGDNALTCRLCIIKIGDKKPPEFKVFSGDAKKGKEIEQMGKAGQLEYRVQGNQRITITWTKK